jgi:hypothetical protein
MISLDSTQARPSNTLAVNRFLLFLGGGVGFNQLKIFWGTKIAMGAYSDAESALIGHYSICNDPARISFLIFLCNLCPLPSVVFPSLGGGGGGAFLKNARSIKNKMGYDPFFETSYFFFLFSLGTTEQIK